MQKANTEPNNRIRVTVLLDDETLKILRDYGFSKFNSTNISKAIMSMVKAQHGTKKCTY